MSMQRHGWSRRGDGNRGRLAARTSAAVAVLGSVLAAVLALAFAGGSAGAQSTATKQVAGLLPGLSLATAIGSPSATRELQIGVGISRPDPAAETQLYDEMYDSSSPLYHHFLTVSQFNARFGVRPATTAAVRSFLTSGGLTIDTSSAGGDYFTATGTVAQLDALFNTTIGSYTYKGTQFLANDVAPSVPANLPIDAVAGLQTLSHYSADSLTHRQLAEVASAQAAIAAGRRIVARSLLPGDSGAGPQAGTEQTYTPQDLWGIYDDPGAAALTNASGTSTPATVAASKTALGQGQTVGIFGEGETSSIVDQLRLFEAATGLPKVPVRTVETEGGPDSAYGDNSGATEWYLDSQSSTGMAPDVRQLDLYFAKGFQDSDIAQDFNDWANDPNGPREMNASFGECEQNPTLPVTGPLGNLPAGVGLGGEAEELSDPSLRQAAMEGRTLFTSAGDTGSGCAEVYAPVLGGGNGLVVQPVPFQSYPCVSDYAVCVGGTVVSSPGTGYPSAAKRTAETSWTYSGGGSSYFNPEPTFQQGVSAITTHCVSNDTGTTVYAPGTAPVCRGVPDVADMSGNSTGGDAYFIYIDGQPSSEGGTSLSSPLMMGQWARIQSAATTKVQAAGGLGYANPLIYRQAKGADDCTTAPCSDTTYERDFTDITASEFGAGNGAFRPQGGWDYASGWGALNVANFMRDVTGSTSAAHGYTGSEQAAAKVCLASMTGPADAATDPVTGASVDEGVNLSAASLTSHGSSITATLTVSDLAAGPPAEATSGANFYVAWEYDGVVYYAKANELPGGAGFQYTSGTTGPAMTSGTPNAGSYSDTASSAATGSANETTGVITITVPASEVGSPPAGALLTTPQAFVQITVGAPEVVSALSLTTDSADNLRGYSVDDGELDSIGESVVMGGSGCTNTLPVTPTTTTTGGGTVRCTSSRLPVTHITGHTLTASELRLRGYAAAHCPDRIVTVSLAVAHAVGRRCSFLGANHRFGRFGSCTPHDYLRAKGTSEWTFALRVHLVPGVYHLWEHAVDSRRYATHNTARKYVWFRIR